MSVADLYDLELIWPSLGPTDVIVTGTFDQWSSSIRLAKGEAGFVGTVKVPWGQKIAYKFIVDGDWQCRDDLPQEDDGNGNVNNVLQTPGKPEVAFVPHDPPRLSIPVDGALSEGYSAVENMVTAVEFFPPAEPAAARAPLPPPIPQITVEGPGQGPSPVNEFKLNTATATEGNISPASVTPARVLAPSKPSSRPVSILPLNDSDSVPYSLINRNGEASGVIMTHAPIQFSKGATLTSRSLPGSVEAVAVTPSVSAEPEPSHPPQVAQVDDPSATPEPITKQPEVVLSETAAQDQPQQDPIVTTASTTASGTLVHKKRLSFFARIKRIFDKKKDRQEGKENKK